MGCLGEGEAEWKFWYCFLVGKEEEMETMMQLCAPRRLTAASLWTAPKHAKMAGCSLKPTKPAISGVENTLNALLQHAKGRYKVAQLAAAASGQSAFGHQSEGGLRDIHRSLAWELSAWGRCRRASTLLSGPRGSTSEKQREKKIRKQGPGRGFDRKGLSSPVGALRTDNYGKFRGVYILLGVYKCLVED